MELTLKSDKKNRIVIPQWVFDHFGVANNKKEKIVKLKIVEVLEI